MLAFACQYIVSPRGRTCNRTVTQMPHLLLVAMSKDDQVAHDDRACATIGPQIITGGFLLFGINFPVR